MSPQPSTAALKNVTPLPPRTLTPSGSDAEAFVLRLGRALHTRGIPSHRLEEAMQGLSRRLGLDGTFFSTPTAMFASFSDGKRPDVHLIRVGATNVDLGSLSELDEVSTQVAEAAISPAEGLARVEAIEKAPARYPRWLVALAFAINSAAATAFFGGGLREMGVALAIGLSTGLLALFTARDGKPWRAFEPTAAFCAAAIASVAAHLVGPVAVPVAIIAGLIALLPGYSLTVSINEIATGHLASGSARITSAMMAFFTLAFGVALGTRVVDMALGPVPVALPTAPLPLWAILVALAVATATFAILFAVSRRDLVWVIGVAFVGFWGARLGSALFGPELGVFVGALVVGASSNAFARLKNRPAVVPLFPGIMLLVPGSIGFRSLSSLMAHDVVSGVQTAFTMALVAVALVAGLIVSSELVNPRRPL